MSLGGGLLTNPRLKNLSLSAVKIKADGTTEDLGVIAYHDRSKFKMLRWYLSNPRALWHEISKLWRVNNAG